MMATVNCRRGAGRMPPGSVGWMIWLALVASVADSSAPARDGAADPADFAEHIRREYTAAQQRYLAESTNAMAAWTFARASFDRAELATNKTERAAIAQQGIQAGRQLIARDPKSAPGHYYLGMNLGQLARTKTLGALRIVDEMERKFKMARTLDERLDHAGPDRNLGLLYLEAPSIGSIGNRHRARLHLERAVELSPGYPENRLNLAEAYLHWREYTRASREVSALDELWPEARTVFTGVAWTASWRDWEARRQRIRSRLEERGKGNETSRRQQ